MQRSELPDRILIAFLLLLIALGFWLNLHAVPLFDLDEGAFGDATREMLARGDYLSTWLYGEPRHDKPILIYWLQALSVNTLGLHEFALRLPSALAATAWVLAIWWLGERLVGRRAALIAAAITAASLLVLIIGRAATADALLNLWIAVAMLAIGVWWRERRTWLILLAHIAIGLGFLTKGPIAVAIPFVVSALFFLGRGEWRAWLGAVFHPGGLALFLLIALPWYIAQYLSMGPAFLEGFLLEHNVSRYSAPMHGHAGGYLYYLPVALLAVLPFTTLLLRTLGSPGELWRSPEQRYLLLWFGFVFVFFSFSGTKLPHYLLYGLSGLFLLMALRAERLRDGPLLYLPAWLVFAALLFLPELLGLVAGHSSDVDVVTALDGYQAHFGLGWRLFFLAAVALTSWLAFEPRLPALGKLLGIAALHSLAIGALLIPVVGQIVQMPMKEAGLLARDIDAPTVMWRANQPTFNVYADRTVERREPEPGDLVFTRSRHLDDLGLSYRELYRRGGFSLIHIAKS